MTDEPNFGPETHSTVEPTDEEVQIHKLAKRLDSLQLELLASQHAHRKDNEYHQEEIARLKGRESFWEYQAGVHAEQKHEINALSIKLGAKAERLDEAIRRALDVLTGWCAPNLAGDKDVVEKVLTDALVVEKDKEREARKNGD